MDSRELENKIFNELASNEDCSGVLVKNLKDLARFTSGILINEWSERVNTIVDRMGNEALRAGFSAGGFEYLSVPPMSYFKDMAIVDMDAWRSMVAHALAGSSTALSQVLAKETLKIAGLCIEQEKKSKLKSCLTIEQRSMRIVRDISIILAIAVRGACMVIRDTVPSGRIPPEVS